MTQQEEIYLLHYGKKGMKWGIRKDASKEDRKWAKKQNKNLINNSIKAYNLGADEFNNNIDNINVRAKQKAKIRKENYDSVNKDPNYPNYIREVVKIDDSIKMKKYSEVIDSVSPSGLYQAKAIYDGSPIAGLSITEVKKRK